MGLDAEDGDGLRRPLRRQEGDGEMCSQIPIGWLRFALWCPHRHTPSFPAVFTHGEARAIGISDRHLYRWRDDGTIDTVAIGIYAKSDLEAANNTHNSRCTVQRRRRATPELQAARKPEPRSLL